MEVFVFEFKVEFSLTLAAKIGRKLEYDIVELITLLCTMLYSGEKFGVKTLSG